MRADNFYRRGFTMIELVVVMAVIAILSTLVVVSLENAKMTSRDVRRLTDVKQIQLALKMYYNDTGRYPTSITAGASIANRGSNYLLRVPSNPKPWNDNTCANSDYVYTSLENGQRYTLSFCLGDQTDDLSGGQKTATANGILECGDGYVMVPGSATFDTNDFCVMKYEAKCVEISSPEVGLSSPATAEGGYDNESSTCDDSRQVASVASGVPVTNISQEDAKTFCAAIGGHLMTNAEWMTIARNAEQIAANWDGGTVGSGELYGGFLGSGITNATQVDNSPGSRNKYGLRLSTGQYIWHLGNNVSEWTDDTCVGGDGIGKYSSLGDPTEWTASELNDYERSVSGPSDPSWDSSKGIGNFTGCPVDGYPFIRGGDNNGTSHGNGLFNLVLTEEGSGTISPWTGFRCVK